jgi:Fuc2NAc and GlcNAc transferase
MVCARLWIGIAKVETRTNKEKNRMLISWPVIAVVLVFAFVLSVFAVRRFHHFALAQGLVDNPNSRSSHQVATPRGGGLVFVLLWCMAGVLFTLFGTWSAIHALTILPGALCVAVIGYMDDHCGVSPAWRALVHFAAALSCVIFLGGMDTLSLGDFNVQVGWFSSALAVLAIMWSINLFNFMDGTDGIASVEALSVLIVGGAVLWQAGGAELAISAWILAASVGGFLVWNWPKASIFMGDVGSGFLGFIIAVFALSGEKWFGVPALLWAILYVVFWFDATVTLIRRIAAGERWYSAHRSHAYQRLHHLGGWSHRKILWAVIGLNIIFGCLAIYGNAHRDQLFWLLLTSVVVAGILYAFIERIAPMYKNEHA